MPPYFPFDALLKVGGSLYHAPTLPALAAEWAALAAQHRLLILPGGGPFADAVRDADARFPLGDSAAHWMAILAMDQYAYLLARLIPHARVVRHWIEATTVCDAGCSPVLAPSELLRGHDPLPHSWQVTSDSIAAWLARTADIPLLVLLKSVVGVTLSNAPDAAPPVPQISLDALATLNLVDAHFPQALATSTRCWLIHGEYPARLASLLRDGETMGTRIIQGR